MLSCKSTYPPNGMALGPLNRQRVRSSLHVPVLHHRTEHAIKTGAARLPALARAGAFWVFHVLLVPRRSGSGNRQRSQRPLHRPRHDPLHLLPAREQAVRLPAHHGVSRAGSLATAPHLEHPMRGLLHRRGMLHHLHDRGGLRPRTQPAPCAHNRHRHLRESHREGASGNLPTCPRGESSTTLAVVLLHAQRRQLHGNRPRTPSRDVRPGESQRPRRAATPLRPHHVPQRHLAVSGYLILGHSEIIRSRAKFAYQKDSVYQKQPEAIIS